MYFINLFYLYIVDLVFLKGTLFCLVSMVTVYIPNKGLTNEIIL